jgi:hypothetical protein
MIFEAGTEYVVFGPEEEIKKLVPIVERNYAAMQQGR